MPSDAQSTDSQNFAPLVTSKAREDDVKDITGKSTREETSSPRSSNGGGTEDRKVGKVQAGR